MSEYGRIHTDGSRSGGQPIVIREGRTMKGGVVSQESLPNRPAPPAPNKAVAKIEALRQPTQSDEWQAGYKAGVEASSMVLEEDAKKCDCFARNEGECGCGAWCEWKSITSQRAIEIVRALKELSK